MLKIPTSIAPSRTNSHVLGRSPTLLGANDCLGHRHNPSHATTLSSNLGFSLATALLARGKLRTTGEDFFTAGLGNLAVASCLGEMGRKRCIGCDRGRLFSLSRPSVEAGP
jgi:hypothetical protein